MKCPLCEKEVSRNAFFHFYRYHNKAEIVKLILTLLEVPQKEVW